MPTRFRGVGVGYSVVVLGETIGRHLPFQVLQQRSPTKLITCAIHPTGSHKCQQDITNSGLFSNISENAMYVFYEPPSSPHYIIINETRYHIQIYSSSCSENPNPKAKNQVLQIDSETFVASC